MSGILPFIPAIATGVGSIFSGFDNNQNRKEIARQNELDRQFQLDMWNRTNDYNSPIKQMERLKAGGLNPNLVYGNGATTTANNITPMASKPLPAPNTGQVLQSGIMQIADLEQKRMQNDLVASQIFNNGLMSEKIRKDTFNSGLMSEKITQDTFKSVATANESLFRSKNLDLDNQMNQFEFGKQKELREVSIDGQIQLAKKTLLQNKEAEINLLTLDRRNKQMMLESYARLRLMKSQLSNQQLDNAIKTEIKNLRQKGLNESDNVLLRLFSDLLPSKTDTGTFVKSYQ